MEETKALRCETKMVLRFNEVESESELESQVSQKKSSKIKVE
jgi:hypothetical protein